MGELEATLAKIQRDAPSKTTIKRMEDSQKAVVAQVASIQQQVDLLPDQLTARTTRLIDAAVEQCNAAAARSASPRPPAPQPAREAAAASTAADVQAIVQPMLEEALSSVTAAQTAMNAQLTAATDDLQARLDALTARMGQYHDAMATTSRTVAAWAEHVERYGAEVAQLKEKAEERERELVRMRQERALEVIATREQHPSGQQQHGCKLAVWAPTREAAVQGVLKAAGCDRRDILSCDEVPRRQPNQQQQRQQQQQQQPDPQPDEQQQQQQQQQADEQERLEQQQGTEHGQQRAHEPGGQQQQQQQRPSQIPSTSGAAQPSPGRKLHVVEMASRATWRAALRGKSQLKGDSVNVYLDAWLTLAQMAARRKLAPLRQRLMDKGRKVRWDYERLFVLRPPSRGGGWEEVLPDGEGERRTDSTAPGADAAAAATTTAEGSA
jgi:hypothetical protein